MAALSSSSKKIKFNFGYGGEFKLCGNDAKLRYVGGTNRIMAVDRHISYTELIVKLWDMCGPSMNLRCKLPMEDLDSFVHVTSDEDLNEVIEQYDWAGNQFKIRAILDYLPPSIDKLVDDYFGSHKVAQCSSPATGYGTTSILSCRPSNGQIG